MFGLGFGMEWKEGEGSRGGQEVEEGMEVSPISRSTMDRTWVFVDLILAQYSPPTRLGWISAECSFFLHATHAHRSKKTCLFIWHVTHVHIFW
jgi:hypothetical protein